MLLFRVCRLSIGLLDNDGSKFEHITFLGSVRNRVSLMSPFRLRVLIAACIILLVSIVVNMCLRILPFFLRFFPPDEETEAEVGFEEEELEEVEEEVEEVEEDGEDERKVFVL